MVFKASEVLGIEFWVLHKKHVFSLPTDLPGPKRINVFICFYGPHTAIFTAYSPGSAPKDHYWQCLSAYETI